MDTEIKIKIACKLGFISGQFTSIQIWECNAIHTTGITEIAIKIKHLAPDVSIVFFSVFKCNYVLKPTFKNKRATLNDIPINKITN